MKAAITGANGFVGSNLARRLLGEGWSVRGIVRGGCDRSFLSGLDLPLADCGLENAADLARALDGVEVVFHCASRASDWGPMELFVQANVQNTVRLVNAAAAAGARRVVYVGSTVVYGFGGHIGSDESAPKRPDPFPYCLTKLQAEQQVQTLARQHGIEHAIIRPGNVFGPFDRVTTIHLFRFLMAGKYAHVSGGRRLTCPTYVENLVDALVRAGTLPEAAGEDFIITDGLRITWREYIEAICGVLGVGCPKLSVPAALVYPAAAAAEFAWKLVGAANPPAITRYRIRQVRKDYHFSIAKARRVLDFTPQVGLEEAIQRTAQWYRRTSNT